MVSYDLPWNPVRLIQRAGRVDRIGSKHDVVNICNFIPDREFDAFLGLAHKLRSKLETVRAAVGLERAVLEPEELIRALADEDHAVLARIEPSASAESLRRQYEQLPPTGAVPVAAFPGTEGRQFVCGFARGREWLIEPADSDALLERALGETQVTTVDLEPVGRIAQRCLATVRLRSESAPLGQRAAASRLARLIRSRVAELPLLEAQEVYAEADEVLQALQHVVDIETEDEIRVLLQRPWISLRQLLTACKKLLRQREKSVGMKAEWRLTGVLVAD